MRSLFCVMMLLITDPHPSVVVTVAWEGIQAARDEQPVLPDDYGNRRPAQVGVSWSTTEDSRPILYTALPKEEDARNGWKCAACVLQKQELEAAKIDPSLYRVVKHGTDKATGLYPRWEKPDGTLIVEGWVKASDLPDFISKNNTPGNVVASVDGSSSTAVWSALIAHAQRQGQPEGVSQGILPTINVDVPESLTAILDGMLENGATPVEGTRIKWPEGPRKVTFDPPIEITVRKVVEIDIQVESLSVNGREVTVGVASPRLLGDLTVRLK